MTHPGITRSAPRSDGHPAPDPPAVPPTVAVALRGVRKAYGAHPVLAGLDLDVPAGTITAVLGASGCGKTTLLRLLAGFETTDAGTIALHGRTVDDGHRPLAPEHRRIGYVPQEGGLFPHLSVAANIGFGLPRAARRRRVAELLELVGLPGLGDRAPHELSGGQQQRVALARALAPAPQLVLLDEPFSALDAGLRAQLRTDVATALHRSGTTAVLVTHDQDEALSMAELVAVLRDGQIVQAADPATLYQQPVDAEVARFVGEANLLAGYVLDRTARSPLGEHPLRSDPPRLDALGLPAAALIMVRPEQLQLRPATSGNAGAVTGRVLRRDYHGHDTTITLAVPASATSAAEEVHIVARTSGAHHQPGNLVTITVAGPVVALPAAAQRAAT
ncbi:MAG: iron(III) transport system ATP-binding protein [Pseudonocardiales bacterium]|jgi:iron(III) transport system ATP-binding protein|nr:iron(III) transport system ATP-binding protein [Pseudonocardiales bacterium]